MVIKFRQKKHYSNKVGISIKDDVFTFVYFKNENELISFKIKMQDEFQFLSELKVNLGVFKKLNKYQWIIAILPHSVWQKSIVLPCDISKQDRLQQVLFLLENELPISLEKVWFDINETLFLQHVRVDIFAIQQDIAKNYLAKFSPLKITILDHQVYAIKRAFHYLIPTLISKDIVDGINWQKSIFVYQQDNTLIIIAETRQQLIIAEYISQKTTALVVEFCKQHNLGEDKIFLFQDTEYPTNNVFPKNWYLIETDLPFIALGNALWSKQRDV